MKKRNGASNGFVIIAEEIEPLKASLRPIYSLSLQISSN